MVGRFPVLKYLPAAASNGCHISSGACLQETSAWVCTSIAMRSSSFIRIGPRLVLRGRIATVLLEQSDQPIVRQAIDRDPIGADHRLCRHELIHESLLGRIHG